MRGRSRLLHSAVLNYLSDGVPLMTADAQCAVITPQCQQILSTPAATGDLLAMFAWQIWSDTSRQSILQNRLKSIKPSKIIYTVVLCVTQDRDLAWGLLIVDQQVSFDCPDCQQWASLWPQDERHLISVWNHQQTEHKNQRWSAFLISEHVF